MAVFTIPVNQETTISEETLLSKTIGLNPETWFIVLTECNGGVLHSHYQSMIPWWVPGHIILDNLEFFNSDRHLEVTITDNGSHFSQEEQNSIPFFVVIFALACALGYIIIMRFIAELEEFNEKAYMSPLLLLAVACGMMIYKSTYKVCHWAVYAYNGRGFAGMLSTGEYVFTLSQLTISLIFIGLAYGLGINKKKDGGQSFVGFDPLEFFWEEKLISIVTGVICIGHILAVIGIHNDRDEDHKFHDF